MNASSRKIVRRRFQTWDLHKSFFTVVGFVEVLALKRATAPKSRSEYRPRVVGQIFHGVPTPKLTISRKGIDLGIVSKAHRE